MQCNFIICRKTKKNNMNLASADFAQRMLKLKIPPIILIRCRVKLFFWPSAAGVASAYVWLTKKKTTEIG